MIYFVSDYHMKHKNVLQFEERPYQNIEEMDNDFIQKWNEVVTEEDTVVLVGDIIFHGKKKDWIEFLDKTKGKKILVKGNHDDSKAIKDLVAEGYLEDYHEVGYSFKEDGIVYWVTHYPMGIGERPRKYSIHGHIHNQPSQYLNQINVGVDSPHFKDKVPFGQPIPMLMIKEYVQSIDDILHEKHFGKMKGE